MNKEIIAAEVAEQDFERFADAMDLDLDETKMSEEDLSSFRPQKERLLRAISNGHLIFNDEGEPIYTPYRKASKSKEPITFHERTGADLMALDSGKKGQDVKKMMNMMASMCRTHPKTFAGLAGEDIKVCEALFTLLMV